MASLPTALPTRSEVQPHEHAVFVYDDIEDVLIPLEAFIEEGARSRDLSVFVHSFSSNAEAKTFVGQRVPHVEKREEAGDLATAPYRDSFERGGRIDHDHVAGVVGMLQATAKGGDRRAPRIFVDASKNYFDSGRVDEWFAFERWLGPRLAAEVGLVCAYRAKDLQDPKVLQRVLETHQYRFELPR